MSNESHIIVIGDVHGKINRYKKILDTNNSYKSIQVGDFGFKREHKWHLENIDSTKHKINFGNHDDYTFLNKPHSLGNFSLNGKIMTIRGADSIDKAYRTENKDWWRNEELNYTEMQQAIDAFSIYKPEIVITHDCPQQVRSQLFGINEKSITSNGLQAMFEIHQPDLWIFGHHHKFKNEPINGTRFMCLAELDCFII